MSVLKKKYCTITVHFLSHKSYVGAWTKHNYTCCCECKQHTLLEQHATLMSKPQDISSIF